MAELKTKATESDVAAFLDQAEPEQRRADGKALAEMFARVTGEAAAMWGPSIVGYGRGWESIRPERGVCTSRNWWTWMRACWSR